MKYINRNNGAVIDTISKLGGVWEVEKTSQAKPEEKETAPKRKTKKETK